MTHRMHTSLRQRQAGAATLVVVMSLFLIVAMLAAFASRNMVYEQRIASNYYRTGVAYEAAEAGVEWALAMVNGDNVDAACQNSSAGTSLRDRYLRINQSTRVVTKASTSESAMLACFNNGANSWACQCPTPHPTSASTFVIPAAVAGVGLQPTFSVGFKVGGRPGTARLTVSGCTGLNLNECGNNFIAAANSLSRVDRAVDIALVSALKMPPVSPLVARGTVSPGSPAALGLFNTAPSGSGLLAQTGHALAIADLAHAEGLPGSLASDHVIADDTTIRSQAAELFFASFFGMNSDYYRGQPKMRKIDVAASCGGDCTVPLVDKLAAGGQMFWLDAPATFAANVNLGGPTNPVVIIVNGDLTISEPIQIYGLLYVRGNLSWSNGSALPATVTGAVVVEGNVLASGTGAINMVYDATLMQILNNQRGSFVRVPGSAWDQAR
ncbi:PilX N-terminal domain-containing pilus assembly protein [Paucibacter sp. JuS9]|uniref:pilus assembly PilX family protein n=1 Tax=Paucibacter sp. JuS9 TaxID=3228748 RepID=UPI003757EA3F